MMLAADRLAGMIAADTAATNSAALQSAEVAPVKPTAEPVAATDPTSQQETGVSNPEETPSVETPDAPKEETSEDEFDLDLDEEPKTPEPAAEAGQEEMADPDKEIGALLATTRGKRIYSSFKKDQMLAKPEDDGGIGHIPSVEQVKKYFVDHVDRQAMDADFADARPESSERWIRHWFTDPTKAESAAAVVERLPEVLATSNQQAYMRLAQPIVERYAKAAIQRFVEASQTARDEAEQQRFWVTAQMLHHDLYGRYYEPNQGQQQGQFQQQAPNAELEALRRERQQFQREREQVESERVTQFEGQIRSSLENALLADTAKALEPIKGRVADTIFDAVRERMQREIRDRIQRSPELTNKFNLAQREVVRTRNEAALKDLVRQYRQMALPHLQELRKGYIEAAGKAAVDKSTARHSQLQQAAAKTAPSASTAQPVTRDIRQALERHPGETQIDWIERQMKAQRG